MRVFLSAGEASGDAYGAALMREMRRMASEPIDFEGLGGPKMRAERASLDADTARWGAMSIVHSLAVLPRALSGYYRAKRTLRRGTPGLFIPIDFGYANIRLARHAKNRGWKVLYFVPPGSWRRDRQGRDLPALTDAIVTPFEWSAEILRKMGANAFWFGHPIKQLLRERQVAEEVHQETVAVLPGSRDHEIEANLPVIAESVRGLVYNLEFALAPSLDAGEFRARWKALRPEREGDRFTSGDTSGVLRRARAGIVCSGTATLEAVLCQCPMVVMYRISRALLIEAKLLRFKRPKFVALPNILLDRMAVPELVHDEASPEAVRLALDLLLVEGDVRDAQLAAFAEIDRMLGPDDAITRAAELALRI